MITENYKNLLRTNFIGSDQKMTTADGVSKYFSSETNKWCHPDYAPAKGLQNTSSSYAANVSFGRGTTPALASDYTLEDMILSSSYSLIKPTAYRRIVNAEGKTLYTATYTLRNLEETELVINEIGLFMWAYTYTSSGYSSGTLSKMLVDRTVLEEPLIIPPGEIRALTYNLVFDLNFE